MREGQVVWRDLGRDRKPTLLRGPHQVHGGSRRDVSEVEGQVRLGGNSDVASDGRLFGGGGLTLQAQTGGNPAFMHHTARRDSGVFAVVDHREAGNTRELHRVA